MDCEECLCAYLNLNGKLVPNYYCARCAKTVNPSRSGNRACKCQRFSCVPDAFDARVLAIVKEQTGADAATVRLHNKCEKELQVLLVELQSAKENARTRAQAVALAAVPDPRALAMPGAAEKAARLVLEAAAAGAV